MPNPDTHKNQSLDLLLKTFDQDKHKPLSPNVLAFARVYHAIEQGHLTVNGLPPDDFYPLGEYLIHGGRMRFDLSELNTQERQQFYEYIVNHQPTPSNNNHIIQRSFASHMRAGLDAIGNIREIKSLFWGNRTQKARAKHQGINLPIGGEGSIFDNQTVTTDGKWGHMYIYDDHADGFMMIGIENSAPQQKNIRTKRSHSALGISGNISPFNAEKLQDKKWHKKIQQQQKCPLTTKSFNWACVKITPQHLEKILANSVNLNNTQEQNSFKMRLSHPPKNAIRVTSVTERLDQMNKFQKATNVKNSHAERWIFGGGVFLTFVGLFLTFSPFPPGVSQAIGSALTLKGAALMMTAPTMLGFAACLRRTMQVYNIEENWNKVKPIVSYESITSSDRPPEQKIPDNRIKTIDLVPANVTYQSQTDTSNVCKTMQIPPNALLSRSLPANLSVPIVAHVAQRRFSLPLPCAVENCIKELAKEEPFVGSPSISLIK